MPNREDMEVEMYSDRVLYSHQKLIKLVLKFRELLCLKSAKHKPVDNIT